MIPFASQRGYGQDLATHLMNSYDNEVMTVEEVRGAVAQDLHGAFAEWEFQADALTKCKNYLYSMSINPDPEQGPLSREQYRDYISRVEEKLGLTDQPRAIVFHEKYGREHCHVVWSRIKAHEEKAVQLSFDHDKLMMVTREFARDHGLTLPDGYFKDGKGQQINLYQMHQQRVTWIKQEAHKEIVTDIWHASDSPKALVQGLAQSGYILTQGRRDYLLVDYYGGMHALSRLIDDKTARIKEIRDFLGKDYPNETLPDVDQTRKEVVAHRKELEAFLKNEQRDEAIKELQSNQDARRADLLQAQKTLKQKQHKERVALAHAHRTERNQQRSEFLTQSKEIRRERAANKPTGLAAFLGRVSGVEFLRKQIHKYQDRKRHEAFYEEKEQLKQEHAAKTADLQRLHGLQERELTRKVKALQKVDKRELKSLEESLLRDVRIAQRGSREQMPSLNQEQNLDIDKSKAKAPSLEKAFTAAVSGKTTSKDIDLTKEFTKATKEDETDRDDQGSSEAPKPQPENKIRSYRRKRKRDRGPDRGR